MRILVIEDDVDLAHFISKGLKEERYAVDLAADGEEGLELAFGNPYDLLIVDIMLPKLDGLTVCRRLRAGGHRTPVLLMTARNTVEDKVTGFDMGADQFLAKPFAFPELLARIRALLRRSSSQSAPTRLSVADLNLDLVARRVWRGRNEIALTNKEFALLEYMMRNPNQVINRNQILDHLWGYDFDSFSNVVDVHMKNLRKKLNNRRNKVLETIRGIGYKMKVE